MKASTLFALLTLGGLSGGASAEIVTLTFEGLGDNTDVLNYYNGGFAGDGTGPGPNFGVQFNAGARSVVDFDAGGSGNIANEPSGQTALFFFSVNSAIMNVPGGFSDGFGTWFSTIGETGLVEIYAEIDAGGALLGTIELAALGSTPNGGDPTGDFNRWQEVGIAFAGTARSVRISGTSNTIAIDNITFGAVPTPGFATVVMAIGMSLARRRR
jgi:hypothetical protein